MFTDAQTEGLSHLRVTHHASCGNETDCMRIFPRALICARGWLYIVVNMGGDCAQIRGVVYLCVLWSVICIMWSPLESVIWVSPALVMSRRVWFEILISSFRSSRRALPSSTPCSIYRTISIRRRAIPWIGFLCTLSRWLSCPWHRTSWIWSQNLFLREHHS